MDDLMLHVLDVAMNAVAARAHTVRIRVAEDPEEDRLVIRIVDDGQGMHPGLLTAAQKRFTTTKPERSKPIGLGLALLRQTAQMCNGTFRVVSRPRKGTLVEARMQRSHIDRPPLGDCVTTLLDLMVGNPHVGFRYTHSVHERCYTFDSRTVKRVLGGAEWLGRPEVVRWIRNELKKGERALSERRRAEGGRRNENPKVSNPQSEIRNPQSGDGGNHGSG